MGEVLVIFVYRPYFLTDAHHRKQQRRQDIDEDEWTREHPLFPYFSLRVFSLSSQLQIGRVLNIQEPAVHAKVRVRGASVIVRTIGPRCLASVWKAPVCSQDDWEHLHEELTWVHLITRLKS